MISLDPYLQLMETEQVWSLAHQSQNMFKKYKAYNKTILLQEKWKSDEWAVVLALLVSIEMKMQILRLQMV